LIAVMMAQLDPGCEPFDLFLRWLSADRELAMKKHNDIMRRLNKYFVRKGCPEPEELSGETRDRVIKIISSGQNYPNPDALFYSVASKIWHEFLRKPKTEPLPAESFLPAARHETDDRELKAFCLEKCLAQLPASDRDLITRYYQGEGGNIIETRRILMAEHGGENALRVKAHRIRLKLRICMAGCMSGAGSTPQ
jgi:DNA-directed RNA polymerase specialized sigma24 family protein